MTVDQPELPTSRNASESVSDQLPAVLGGFDLTDQVRFSGGFPHEVFNRLRADEPILLHPPGRTRDGESFWVLSRYEDVVEAAANPVFSSQGGGSREGGGTHLDDLPAGTYAGGMLNMMDDPRHQLIKDIVSPAVCPSAVAALEPVVRERASALVSTVLERGTCDLQAEVAGRYSVEVVAALLGVPRQDWSRLVDWAEIAMGYEDRDEGEATGRSQAALLDMYKYGCELVRAKRAEPAGDFMSLIATGEIPEGHGQAPLVDYEREVFFNLISLAGTEPTRNAIAIGLLALVEHPEQWQALRADRSLLDGAVEEALRWSSPTPYNRRTATEDIRFRDVLIREGDKVTLWWASANRDERVFADPFRFDVRRSPNPHLAFGHGAHTCLGPALARMELRVLLEELLDRVERIELTGPVPWARNSKHTVALRVPVALTASS
ncbi:cytochrome P450 [Saccharopolyspora erythraea NRRL 2338]|uniref:Cytochrome P450 monooxygenase n=2 Tax=Saccharopolyspora erythraea TaxID=1836 RepID=A4FH87_SACEN|nr:cytochrome P450 [Saccharopolyspora erythraea]AAQ94244.1 P450 monooxygenase [Saccharopolyspora erythraea]EQD81284.1 cytochrome P450 [Saccharopolyspora erythraea D]PFG97112.1 cytochrome P450 [Saccharopolyspora erythraea NRRL 2338]QRK87318.1 cytochrome P450 [Saccharopolyspora erythraea]CAM03412.1 cytochrome P450 monooxygenase [Saccharopolyspora erythraea NRRL 2338]